MALTPKSWHLNAYTNGTFTTIATGGTNGSVIKALAIANGANAAVVSLRIVTSADVVKSILITGETLVANASYKADLPVITLAATDKLQVAASLAGASFTAFGAE